MAKGDLQCLEPLELSRLGRAYGSLPDANAGSTATSDSFTYCANNGFTPAAGATAASCSSSALTATVTLGASALTGNPTAIAQSYTAKSATYLKIASPGLLA